ncbi:hypothetical protein H0H93_000341 [Arthromyces matolae]|nr:hypothetical protein H0H93_000341 [Arthromyces matolae]
MSHSVSSSDPTADSVLPVKFVVRRFLHRVVKDMIAKPLNKFRNSKHMIQVVSHAFTAHRQAYELCNIIHRDVSTSNILITDSGGVLNDWDMAKEREDIQLPRMHERTGTWQYMSSLLLDGHHSAHTIQDDMESFVLIVLYHALRYLEHNQADRTLYIIEEVFNEQIPQANGTYGGGEPRMYLFQGHGYITRNFQLSSPPLDRWVDHAIAFIKEWIESQLPKFYEPTSEELLSMEYNTGMYTSAHAPSQGIQSPYLADNYEFLSKIFTFTLAAPDWPENDVPFDILPSLRLAEKRARLGYGPQEISRSQMIAASQVKQSAQLASDEAHNPSQPSKRGRMGEDVGGSGQSIKRSRTSVSTTSPRRVTEITPRLPSYNAPSQSRARAEDGRRNAGPSRRSGKAGWAVDPLRRTRASSALSGKKKSPKRRSGGSQPSQNRRKH